MKHQGKTTQRKRKRGVVAHADTHNCVVGWSCVVKPATVWFGGDEAGAISHRVVMFLAFGCARALDCRWCLGQCGLWPTAARWWWAIGSIRGCMQPSGKGLVWVVGCIRRVYDRRGVWWMCELKPTTTRHRGGGSRKPKLAATGWWWAGEYVRGYMQLLGGVVVGGWQPGQGSCCSRGVGGCGLG